jgi:type I restriction enzyme S subunit
VIDGWHVRKIGEVCDLATGGTPSTTNATFYGGAIKWLVSGDIHRREILECEGRITEAGMKASNAKLLPVNSVMIALNGQGKTRGTVAILRTLATCNQSLVSITPRSSSGLLPEFLFINLQGRYGEIRRLTSDADNDRRGLNMGMIREIEVPIAPIPEQQRIVTILTKPLTASPPPRPMPRKTCRMRGPSLRVIWNWFSRNAVMGGCKRL